MRFRTRLGWLTAVVVLLVGSVILGGAVAGTSGGARKPAGQTADGRSPALCGPQDTPEPGIQGEVPAGATANYNCGLTLVGQLSTTGSVQGAGHCAYVRSGASIHVIDVSDPAHPTEIGSVATIGGSESMRAVVTNERAVLVSGKAVYDISDCEHPVLKGQIPWPNLQIAGVPFGLLPHDIRVNHAGTKVYATFGMWEADITNLADPSTWTVTDHSCDVEAQFWPVQMQAAKAGINPCASHNRVGDSGETIIWAADAAQGALMWPALGHGPDTNGADTRLYLAPVGGGSQERLGLPTLSIIDLTQNPPRLLDQIPGAGYGIDWFQTAKGNQFLLRNPEEGIPSQQNPPLGDTCVPERDRPERLGWDFSAFLTEVTHDKAKNVSQLELAINTPKFCEARSASGHDPVIGYHSVDNPHNAKLAILAYGDAGLRVFDIRNPKKPSEVAYFNHGRLTGQNGAPHYDASRGLIYATDSGGFKVLQIQPQVSQHLDLVG
jgi:LVIVD repeat